jgi:excinuclease ABC subunit A
MLNADHIIDLGPQGGTRGGNIVATGTPEEVATHPTSLTAIHLRQSFNGRGISIEAVPEDAKPASKPRKRSNGSTADVKAAEVEAREPVKAGRGRKKG